jgi:hypothetical protein
MHRRNRRSTRGQVIPIAALLAVLLLAFVALTIDGGRGYLDRRSLQSTADLSALSGSAELGRTFKTSLGASKARTSAVWEAVNNLPGTSFPSIGGSAYDGSNDRTGLTLGNDYTMDVSATMTQVHVKLYHQLSLTFGVGAGFGPFITPAAEATAVNDKVPFAVILFRTNCIGGGGSPNCGNLVNSGGGTNVNVTSSDYPTDTGDGLTNEGICPAPGNVDFFNQGNEYAFNPTGSGQYPASSCGNPNVTNVRCTSGDPTPCVSGTVPMVQWPLQLADPGYTEPKASTSCDTTYGCSPRFNHLGAFCLHPGTYDSIDDSKGDVILLPGIYRITSGNFSVSGTTSAVWTVDQYMADPAHAGSPLPGCVGAMPSDSGVIIEMQPQGANGASNQLEVSGGGTFNVSGSATYDHIAVYVENSQTGEKSPTPDPTSQFTTTGGGSQVVTFGSGSVYNIKGSVYGYADNMSFEGGQTIANGVGQILAWTVKLTGGGTINQIYDPASLPQEQGLLR